ncbi:MAG: tetratricopeptide repeat protein [Verrucomicrobia bacterium]|nr:tetratricopeptide repeat protein [Verrucomicrobiota bacterium]MCH8511602.1 tetratricopeptide repeat protein [Kiritimatiellia bacterium]
MMFSRFRLFSLSCFLLALPLVLRADPISDARAQLQAGETSRVDSTLAELLEQEPTPLAALEISFAAARADGRVFTAERRVRELIRREGENNPLWIYEGALVSRDLGEDAQYLDRLMFFARRQTERSEELEQALRTLSLSSNFPEAFRKYREVYGTDRAKFQYGLEMLRRIRAADQAPLLLELAGYLLSDYGSTRNNEAVYEELHEALESRLFGLSRNDVYQVMFSHKVHGLGMIQEMIRRHGMDVPTLFALQRAFEAPLPTDLVRRFDGLRDLENETLRTQLAREYITLEPLYRSRGSADQYRAYAWRLANRPEVFIPDAGRLITERQAADLLRNVISAHEGREQILRGLSRRFFTSHRDLSNRYIADGEIKTALMRAAPGAFHAVDLRELVSGQEENEGMLKALIELTNGRQDVRMELLESFSRHNHGELLLEASRREMILNATSFDTPNLARHFLSSNAVDMDAKIKALNEAYAHSGNTPRFRELVTRRENNTRDSDEMKAFVEGLRDDASAKDPILDILVRVSNDSHLRGRDRNEPRQEFTDLMIRAFEIYGRPFPSDDAPAIQTRYLEDLLARYRGTADRREGRRIYAEVVGPRLSKDADWDQFIQFTVLDNGMDGPASYHAAAAYLAHFNEYIDDLRNAWHPDGNTDPLFRPLFGEMSAEDVRYYLHRNRTQWSPKFLAEQLGAALAAQDLSGGNPVRIRQILERLRDRAEDAAESYPLDLLAEQFLNPREDGEYGGNWEIRREVMRMFVAAGKQSEGVAHMLAGAAKAHPARGMTVISSLTADTGLVPNEGNEDIAPKEGHRRHIMANVLYPMVREIPAGDSPMLYVHNWMHSHINWLISRNNPSEEERSIYRKLHVELVGHLARGARGDANWSDLVPGIERGFDDALERNDKRDLVSLILLAGRESSNVRRNHVEGLIERLETREMWEHLFLFTQLIRDPDPSASALLAEARSDASANVPGIYPVDVGHPAYPLFLASTELAQNNQEMAWTLLRDNLDEFADDLFLFPRDFSAWALERLREVKGENNIYLTRSLELSNLLLTRSDDLPTEFTARIMLNRAEIFRDQRNFDAARLEYQSIRTNPDYQRTAYGRQAMFRDVDLMITMGNVSAAEGLLEYWMTNPDQELQVQANYFQALIAFNNQDDDATREFLDKVFAVDFTHAEARLLHGRWRLRTNYEVDNPEILLGTLRDRTILRPGQPLRITVSDRNLSVVGGGAAIPVLVTTSHGEDREVINLHPSTRDPRLFRGMIDTVLGEAVPGNRVLEINGLDVISYEIEPEFLQSRGMESAEAKTLRVVDDATMMVSAGNLLTEAEQQSLEIQRQMSGGRTEQTGADQQVRPGNPFYVMVRDRDRSHGGEGGSVTVNVETRSGDRIPNFKLKEVEPYSGIFRGEVPTALPPPRAAASDTADGTLPGNTINFNRDGIWRSRADGRQDKWLEADTMNSHLISRVELKTPEVADISEIRLMGRLTGEWVEMGGIPRRAEPSGGVSLRLASRNVSGIDEYRRYFSQSVGTPQSQTDFRFEGETAARIHLRGAFYMSEARDINFHFIPVERDHENALRDAWLFLVLNGEVIANGRASEMHGDDGIAVPLSEGGHVLEVYGFVRHNRDRFILGYERQDGVVEPIPAAWFSVEENPELLAFLSDRAEIKRTGDGFVAEFSEPERLRSLRWEFVRYVGDAISVSEFKVVDAEGETILPGPSDFTDALDNDILEIAPGDQITVTYVDQVTTSGQRRTLTRQLGSRFTNGSIGFFFERLTPGSSGIQSSLHGAYRFRPGDSFMVVVNDADEDVSPAADTVEVTVTTRSGESLTLKAVEQGGGGDGGVHTGRFVALLRTTLDGQTGGDTIRVRPGDRLTASYVDKENTNPGIPVTRTAELGSVQASEPQVTMFHTWRERREDTGDEARRRIEQIQARTGNDDINRMFTWDRFAMPMSENEMAEERITVNVDAPLPFEILHPSRAMHSGSTLRLRAYAASELASAQEQGREPEGVNIPVGLGRARGGLAVRPNPAIPTPDTDEVTAVPPNATFGGVLNFALGQSSDSLTLEGGGVGANTLLVQGNDQVRFQLYDDQDQLIFERELQLASEGSIALLDSTFQAERTKIHLGQRFFVQVIDSDRDISPRQDEITVRVEAEVAGSAVDLVLRETLRNSGIFTGVIVPQFARSEDAPPLEDDEMDASLMGIPTIDVGFGDKIRFTYQDETGLPNRPPQTHTVTGEIFDGSDGKVFAFTKRFEDPEMAVRVQFRLAESLFEMAKDYRRLEQTDRSAASIAEGKRILEEALMSYPETELVVQGEYLLANLYQELGAEAEKEDPEGAREFYQEALGRFSSLLSNYPDSDFAPRAQFHKALCLEKLGDFATASEEYVKMTYIFPDSPLVGDAAIRLATHYYRNEQRYDIAGRIYSNFYHRFSGHPLAPRALFMSAQSHMKQAEVWEDEVRAQGRPEREAKTQRVLDEYRNAVNNFQTLIDDSSGMVDNEVRAQAMYWAGDASLRGLDYPNAYIFLRRTVFEYPESEWARRARGLLMQSEEQFRGLD